PEQASGAALDARSDIYSLGATFYHLVAGRLPFEAPTPVAMIVKHLSEPLRSPRAVNPAVPYPIASAIQKMMAKRPGERFQDYDALIRELERAQSSIVADTAGPRAAGAVAAPQSWSGTTGAELRGRAGRGPLSGADERPARAGGFSWMLIVLAALLGGLVVTGALKHRQSAFRDASAGQSTVASAVGEPVPGQEPVETQMSYTNRPAGDVFQKALRPGMSVEERLRDRYRQKSRASLSFLSNDHSVLPDGRIKVFG